MRGPELDAEDPGQDEDGVVNELSFGHAEISDLSSRFLHPIFFPASEVEHRLNTDDGDQKVNTCSQSSALAQSKNQEGGCKTIRAVV